MLKKFLALVKLNNFLKFLGIAGLVAVLLLFCSLKARILGFVSLGVLGAGAAYEKLYKE